MRIKVSKKNDIIVDKLKKIYNFKSEGLLPRIALALSLQSNKKFDLNTDVLPPSDGRDYRDEKSIFGTIIDGKSNYVIFKAIMDQYYSTNLDEENLTKLIKLHMDHGLEEFDGAVQELDITGGAHIIYLSKMIRRGLNLRQNQVYVGKREQKSPEMSLYTEPLKLNLGKTSDNNEVNIVINDLNEFDNRNIAIAGMAGSGKTQFIKDILFQLSKNTSNKLKFIFFDYKGEGNVQQLKEFLSVTGCDFIDLVETGIDFNPFLSIAIDERQRIFSVKSFVDTIATFVPNIGVRQKNILETLIIELFESNSKKYPTLDELKSLLKEYYENNNLKQDTLYSIVHDISTGLFTNCQENKIFDRSIYLNLPPSLSDTLRQLCVFLLLRFFNTYFSSQNDLVPENNIHPLSYVIVIDEAHVYLKNKNARKALEELLRLLRSKGVIVILLSQGVEDYKSKEFDFVSQVKLPICLNLQNKDYKLIKGFLGTPRSEYKLQSALQKLDKAMGVINFPEPLAFKIRQFYNRNIVDDTEIEPK